VVNNSSVLKVFQEQNLQWDTFVDASNNETRKLISDLNDPHNIYLRHEKPVGAAAANNTGMKAARGRFVNFLDDDDEYLPGILQKQFD
jgi:glycosyltransferase involved in cell wall biosynthesis